MEKKQKSVLLTVAAVIVAYIIGAISGFPFVQNRLMKGSIGRANKQQEQLNSPSDVKLAEKYNKDTAYCNKLSSGFVLIYAQTQATLGTLEQIKNGIAPVNELKLFTPKVDEAIESAKSLEGMLTAALEGLKHLKEKKPVSELSLTLSQALNLFQIMNSRLTELDGFATKANELAKQKKLNEDLIKTYSEYMIETAHIAATCGDYERALQYSQTFAKIPVATNVSKALFALYDQTILRKATVIDIPDHVIGELISKVHTGYEQNISNGTVNPLNDKSIVVGNLYTLSNTLNESASVKGIKDNSIETN